MFTTSDSILEFLKPHISKNKTCFENPVKNLSDGTLKFSKIKLVVFLNWISKKLVPIFFWNLTPFFDFKFKNTSNLIFLGFKVPSESFFPKNFKIGLTFWHMWFKDFQNWVRSCQHIDGTPCNCWPKMKLHIWNDSNSAWLDCISSHTAK